jgi:hypothetical protein
MAFRGGGVDSPIRIDTPEPFKQVLLGIARSVVPELVETIQAVEAAMEV